MRRCRHDGHTPHRVGGRLNSTTVGTPGLISSLEERNKAYKQQKVWQDHMKGIKKGKVSQRQAMSMKQNMLDHFLHSGALESGNKAALIRSTMAKSVNNELPGLMKQRKTQVANTNAGITDLKNQSRYNTGASFDAASDQRHASTRKDTR